MENKRSKVLVAVIVLLIAGLIASIVMIYNLTEKIDNMQASFSNQLSTMNASINSIYSNVNESLEKQASIVSSTEENKGNLDEKTLTVPVSLKIVPKSVTDDTKLSVEIGDNVYPLSKTSEAEFSAKINVPLFNTEEAYLLVKSGDETKAELLEDVYITDMWYSYLPMINHADFTGNNTYTKGSYTLNGKIHIDCDESAKMDKRGFEKVSLEAFLNGKKVWEQDSTDAFNKANGEIPITKGFEMKPEDTFTIDVVAVDGAGIIHRYTAHSKSAEDTQLDEMIESVVYAGDILYYPDGKQVFE
ncbi:MAG: hypothetical protein IJZ57_00790 [Clostridia bacterium]|nr:hypothetical protein [Clostridia bacterium]